MFREEAPEEQIIINDSVVKSEISDAETPEVTFNADDVREENILEIPLKKQEQILETEEIPNVNIPEVSPEESYKQDLETSTDLENSEQVVENFVDMLDIEEPEITPEITSALEKPEISSLDSVLQKPEIDDLPDFLKPENITKTVENHDEHVERRETLKQEDESSQDSEDEFALFLANAQEKEEDERFDTSYNNEEAEGDELELDESHSLDHIFEDTFADQQQAPVSFTPPSAPEIPAPEPVEQEDDFLNFLNKEQEQEQMQVQEQEEPVFLENSEISDEEFGDDFLAALKEENPELSPIETPAPEIFEIEKPSEAPIGGNSVPPSPFEEQMAQQPIQHIQPENSSPLQQNTPVRNPFV